MLEPEDGPLLLGLLSIRGKHEEDKFACALSNVEEMTVSLWPQEFLHMLWSCAREERNKMWVNRSLAPPYSTSSKFASDNDKSLYF